MLPDMKVKRYGEKFKLHSDESMRVPWFLAGLEWEGRDARLGEDAKGALLAAEPCLDDHPLIPVFHGGFAGSEETWKMRMQAQVLPIIRSWVEAHYSGDLADDGQQQASLIAGMMAERFADAIRTEFWKVLRAFEFIGTGFAPFIGKEPIHAETCEHEEGCQFCQGAGSDFPAMLREALKVRAKEAESLPQPGPSESDEDRAKWHEEWSFGEHLDEIAGLLDDLTAASPDNTAADERIMENDRKHKEEHRKLQEKHRLPAAAQSDEDEPFPF